MFLLLAILFLSLFIFRDFFIKNKELPYFLSSKKINDFLRDENINLQKKILLLEEEKNLYYLIQKNLYEKSDFPIERAKFLLEESKKCLLCIELCYKNKVYDFSEIFKQLSDNNFANRKTLLWCESYFLTTNQESRSLLIQELHLLIKWFSLYIHHLMSFCNFFSISEKDTEIEILLSRLEKII